YNMGYIHPDVAGETTQGDEYIAGKTMVQFTSNMFVSNREVEPVDFEWKLGPILKQKEQATYGAVGSLGIASNSKNKEAAVEVLKFLTNEESQRAINEASSYIPTRKSAGDIYDDHEVLSQVVDKCSISGEVSKTRWHERLFRGYKQRYRQCLQEINRQKKQ